MLLGADPGGGSTPCDVLSLGSDCGEDGVAQARVIAAHPCDREGTRAVTSWSSDPDAIDMSDLIAGKRRDGVSPRARGW